MPAERPRRANADRLLRKRDLPELEEAREQLVAYLRKAGGIGDDVLSAIGQIPRHAFAPPALWRMSYSDIELWGPTAFLPRPSTVARSAQAVRDRNGGRVLEYATGTGYTTSILSLLCDQVYTVEHDPWQLWLSSDAFRELELQNISQKASDGRLGWPEQAPFDAIVVSAALPRPLEAFLNQLTDGGVLVAPIGSYFGPHQLTVTRKTAHGRETVELGECFYPPLTGVWAPPQQTGVADHSPETNAFWSAEQKAREWNSVFGGASAVEGDDFAGGYPWQDWFSTAASNPTQPVATQPEQTPTKSTKGPRGPGS
jgi:protein-L-isoaspartate(D-aspartate) O-methyltransferase